MLRGCRTVQAACTALAFSGMLGSAPAAPRDIDKLEHILIIYLENHSFDNLFGNFDGANGIKQARAARRQIKTNGEPFDLLPPPEGPFKAKKNLDPRLEKIEL